MNMFKNRFLKIITIFLFLLSLTFIVFNIYRSSKEVVTPQNQNVSNQAVDLSWVLPGKTSKDEVISKLGTPIKDDLTTNNETLYYNSTSKTRNNQIILEDESVVLVKEMISYLDSKKVSSITTSYGISTDSLFGPDSAGGNKLYIYPDKGIAYIGDPKFDTLEEIWYFVPTSIEKFKETWALGYSETQKLNLY